MDRLAPRLQLRRPVIAGAVGIGQEANPVGSVVPSLEVLVNPRRQILSALFLGAMTFSLVGCNSDSSSVTSPNDTAPPQAPANLHARFDVPTKRDWLGWTPSSSANVTTYEVRYSTSPSGNDYLLTTVDAATSELALPLVSGPTTEYYRVRAINASGNPSGFTQKLQVDRAGWSGTETPGGPAPGSADDN